MHLWEEIFLIGSSLLIVLCAVGAQFGRGGRAGRLVFLLSAVALGWFFFRFQSAWPERVYEYYLFPHDVNLALSAIPLLWLAFSLVFAREDYKASISRYRIGLALAILTALFFVAMSLKYHFFVLEKHDDGGVHIFLSRLGQYFLLYLIVISAMTMINFESTYRAGLGIYRRKLQGAVLSQAFLLVMTLISCSLVLLGGEINRQYIAVFSLLTAFSFGLIMVYFLRYESQQSGVFVRTQAAYSSIGIIVIGFYLVLAGAIGKIIQLIGGDVRLFVSVLAAMLVFLALLALLLSRSIKERIKTAVDRTFYSGQLDFEEDLAGFSEDIATIFDPEELTEKILALLRDRVGIGKLYLFYTDTNQNALVMISPRHDDTFEDFTIPVNGYFADWIYRHGEAIITEELKRRISREQHHLRELEVIEKRDIAIALPLIAKRRLVGLMFLGPKASNQPFQHQEIQFISSIGHQFALALFSARLSEELMAARQIESFHKFTAFVLHDLKNSVSMLSMLLQNYEANMDNPEFQKSAMTTIHGAVKRMQRVIEKLQTGDREERFSFCDCNLSKIILSLEKRLELADIDNVEYEHSLDMDKPVNCDPDKLEEVLRNLVLNALEAMKNGGRLSLRTFEQDNRAVLEVSDTGEGMSPEFVSKKLFKPFSTTKKKGLGIGLFQSREWIEKMNGKIVVKSNPGQGTTFSLLLPLENKNG